MFAARMDSSLFKPRTQREILSVDGAFECDANSLQIINHSANETNSAAVFDKTLITRFSSAKAICITSFRKFLCVAQEAAMPWKLNICLCRLGSRFWNGRGGSVAIIFGLALLPMMMMMGVAVDYSRATVAKSRLQQAVDAAVLAGRGDQTASRDATALKAFNTNLGSQYVGATATFSMGANGSYSGVASVSVPTAVMKIAHVDTIAVGAKATAAIVTGAGSTAKQCVLLTKPDGVGLYANSGGRLEANCGIQVNSSSSTEAIYINSASHVTATSVKVVGNANINSGSTVSPTPTAGAASQADPLSSLAEPAAKSNPCAYTDYKVSQGQTQTMSPGVYCKTTLIENGGIATMSPGVYVFREGEFVINSGGKVTGSGVMLYFRDKDGRLNVNSDSMIDISAPTSGTYAGMLIFQSRDVSDDAAPPFIVNSRGDTKFEGTIYIPKGTLEFNSYSTGNQLAAYTAIVARKMELNSTGTIKINSNFSGTTPLPPLLSGFGFVTTVTGVRLTQ
jgi:Flp pilus assembly protein TadG